MADAYVKATEEQGKDSAAGDRTPPEDTADAAAHPPKRKSHRPSLEVVQVTVESFYDKDTFKQELQVGRIWLRQSSPLLLDRVPRYTHTR